MQFEVIIPLIAYLVVVFGLSLYAMRKRASGSFLNEYFLGSRSMGGFVLAMTPPISAPAHLSADPAPPINTAWAGCCWR